MLREITVTANDAGQRLDKFIRKTLVTLPLPLLYKYLRLKKIKVNGARADGGLFLCEGDRLTMYIPEEFFAPKAGADAFKKLTPRLSVVYEDENILLCDKRAGMLAHSDDNQDTDTLIDHIKSYMYRKGEYDPDSEHSFAPALCNRIDRNTAGIVIAAKNAEALRDMNERIRNGEIDKRYLCVVHGIPEKQTGVLRGYIVKNSADNIVKVFDRMPKGSSDAKEAITEYRILKTEKDKDIALLEVRLLTGRTHQIRAQMSHAGHPLLGDGKYGVNRDDKKLGYKFQALYSYKLTFDFRDGEGKLSYLRGKTFSVPDANVWFLGMFSK